MGVNVTVWMDELDAADRLKLLTDYPIQLGIVNTVIFSEKLGRYIVKFGGIQPGYNTAKITQDAAQYLLTHGFNQQAKPYVNAAMLDGEIVSVLLRYISKD